MLIAAQTTARRHRISQKENKKYFHKMFFYPPFVALLHKKTAMLERIVLTEVV
jgi:hypothetical protein